MKVEKLPLWQDHRTAEAETRNEPYPAWPGAVIGGGESAGRDRNA